MQPGSRHGQRGQFMTEGQFLKWQMVSLKRQEEAARAAWSDLIADPEVPKCRDDRGQLQCLVCVVDIDD